MINSVSFRLKSLIYWKSFYYITNFNYMYLVYGNYKFLTFLESLFTIHSSDKINFFKCMFKNHLFFSHLKITKLYKSTYIFLYFNYSFLFKILQEFFYLKKHLNFYKYKKKLRKKFLLKNKNKYKNLFLKQVNLPYIRIKKKIISKFRFQLYLLKISLWTKMVLWKFNNNWKKKFFKKKMKVLFKNTSYFWWHLFIKNKLYYKLKFLSLKYLLFIKLYYDNPYWLYNNNKKFNKFFKKLFFLNFFFKNKRKDTKTMKIIKHYLKYKTNNKLDYLKLRGNEIKKYYIDKNGKINNRLLFKTYAAEKERRKIIDMYEHRQNQKLLLINKLRNEKKGIKENEKKRFNNNKQNWRSYNNITSKFNFKKKLIKTSFDFNIDYYRDPYFSWQKKFWKFLNRKKIIGKKKLNKKRLNKKKFNKYDKYKKNIFFLTKKFFKKLYFNYFFILPLFLFFKNFIKQVYQIFFIKYNISRKLIKHISIKKDLNINIFFIIRRADELSANLLLYFIIGKIQNYYKLPYIVHITNKICQSYIQLNLIRGYKILCMGRFSRKDRASYIWRSFKIPLNSTFSSIDFSWRNIILKYSICIIKIWICR